ncbi:hypothetical protein SELMODRAFT_176281 [Selaginella moellendorffii]|uniref:At4g15545-like C-terminal domain-containing protein n=1 Tax=Selaginella moellendorffii TaxID=88036 RepID=D8S227_SELML|nr:uncharacterized protein At4g15545 [Selaginella moellendorffii]XP_024538278.1 uncharacterized protein At4g15545 [Selaginella moellendorffii]XP_024538279.1 uncharacterized protein At4g15545 [Selaginella moellendorffii]EFJ21393.1 hypothetical protein SELMODRAFT_176281 [Selaginella moellendorffii]|eukprot:XP_002977389.1 uncharacterized protein At4g15545 [Selaginella moellendorffii]
MSEEEARLPQSLMRVLPDDPYEQLDLARKIASMALATRMSELENRVGRIRENLHEKDNLIEDLERRITDADQAIQRANIRILKTTDDQIRLSKENEVLQGTITRLRHDVSKMESVRKSLVHTLQLDNPHLLDTADEKSFSQENRLKKAMSMDNSPRSPLQEPIRTQSYDRVQVEDDMQSSSVEDARRRMLLLKARPARRSMSDFAKTRALSVPRQFDHESDSPLSQEGIALTPPISPPKTSPPKSRSATGSPVKHKIPAPTPPQRPRYSEAATAPSSPPRSPSMMKADGKEFFRQAKSRLPYDQFRALLNTIKELNSHLRTREDALRKADEIFGTENKDLYAFLCQHLPS